MQCYNHETGGQIDRECLPPCEDAKPERSNVVSVYDFDEGRMAYTSMLKENMGKICDQSLMVRRDVSMFAGGGE